MIEIKGSSGKSDIFNILVAHGNAVGIIFDDYFFTPAESNVFAIAEPTPEVVIDWLENDLKPSTRRIVIYSNYSNVEIYPFLKAFSKINSYDFIVMYRGSSYVEGI